MPPNVPTFFDLNLVISAPENDDSSNLLVTFQRFVDVLLERDNRTSSIAAIRSNHHLRLTVVDSIFDSFGTKTAKYNRVVWLQSWHRPTLQLPSQDTSACRL